MVLTWVLHVGSHPLCFYDSDRAHCLTFHRIRDGPGQPTLTSSQYYDPTGMTVEECTDACKNNVYAGLEESTYCCKYTPRPSLQGVFHFRGLITCFGCPQIVEMS
jgi:hypothetical protein